MRNGEIEMAPRIKGRTHIANPLRRSSILFAKIAVKTTVHNVIAMNITALSECVRNTDPEIRDATTRKGKVEKRLFSRNTKKAAAISTMATALG